MELWKKLLPEDTEIDGAFYLAKVSVVRTKAELEELVKELYLKIGISGKIEKKPLSEEMSLPGGTYPGMETVWISGSSC